MDFNNTIIDSLQIRIPIEKERYDKLFPVLLEVIKETGKIVSEKRQRRFSVQFRNHVIYFYSINEFNKRFLISIGLSSKFMRNYKSGLQYSEVLHILKELGFSDENILSAEVIDIDITNDIIINSEFFQKWILSNKHLYDYIVFFYKKQVTGFQFGSRKSATFKKPFLKVYNKYNDLKKRNELSLYPSVTPDTWRFEVTLKNRKILYRLALPFKLVDFLNLPSERLNQVFNFLLSFYFSSLPSPDLEHYKNEIAILKKPKSNAFIDFIAFIFFISLNNIDLNRPFDIQLFKEFLKYHTYFDKPNSYRMFLHRNFNKLQDILGFFNHSLESKKLVNSLKKNYKKT